MMGASAQECSALMPILPFLKTINVNDLSNHLHDTKTFMQLTRLQRQKQIQTTCLFFYGWPQLTVSTPPVAGRGDDSPQVIKRQREGLPWWLSGKEFRCQ